MEIITDTLFIGLWAISVIALFVALIFKVYDGGNDDGN